MDRLTLPFAHLNLRRNPFGELPPEERPERAVVEIERWIAPLVEEPRFALQVVGDSGRGKTTHLVALRARLPRATYRHIGEGEHVTAREVASGRPTIIDECQRLSPRARSRVFRRHEPLLIGSHIDHTAELVRVGCRVETIEPAASLDVERLASILTVRIEASRRGEGAVPRLRAGVLDVLLARFGTDVRAMEHCLYEVFQSLSEVRDVEVLDLD